jgi:hypothetical protein
MVFGWLLGYLLLSVYIFCLCWSDAETNEDAIGIFFFFFLLTPRLGLSTTYPAELRLLFIFLGYIKNHPRIENGMESKSKEKEEKPLLFCHVSKSRHGSIVALNTFQLS